jgi:hypothetical protein
MDHVFIFGYIVFTCGMLFLLGLIMFSWVTLRKIRQRPFR